MSCASWSIEDDREAAAYLVKGLTESGHRVDLADDGRQGSTRATQRDRSTRMIIDRMLPGLDGLSIIAALRAANNTTPVLVLSGLGRCRGSRQGLARRLRRLSAEAVRVLGVAGAARGADAARQCRDPAAASPISRWTCSTRTVTRAERAIDLLPREFRLLEYLMRHAGHIVTRTMLLEKVWDHHFDPQTNVIDVHVSRLRQKIDKGFEHPLLHTVRGAGYTLRAP